MTPNPHSSAGKWSLARHRLHGTAQRYALLVGTNVNVVYRRLACLDGINNPDACSLAELREREQSLADWLVTAAEENGVDGTVY